MLPKRLDPSIAEPGRSPWKRILVRFDWIDQYYDPSVAECFRPLRDFVVAAASSPVLDDRYVYPSTINLTIFKTNNSVDYSEAQLHPRVVVSPQMDGKIRVWYFLAGQTGEPEGKWLCDPLEGIAVIRECFGDNESDIASE